MPNFHASMIVRMNNDLKESQINLGGHMAQNVPFYSKVSTKIIIFSNQPKLKTYTDIFL